MLKIGVVGTSRKKNEQRVAIHPKHLERIPEAVRRQLVFEESYGAPFGMSDATLGTQAGGTASRATLFSELDAILLPKPVLEDFQQLREGRILWGWPHCVQQRAHTQAAIDRKLTLISFEEMFIWSPDGHRGLHTFYKNNEMAGYCAVLHALRLMGADGHYGEPRKTVILSFGAVSRGAIYALKARGIRDITICIQRPDHLVREEVLGCHYLRMRRGEEGEARMVAIEHDGSTRPLIDVISEADILVNGIFQDPNRPLTFVTDEEIPRLKPGCVIIDVSCDEGMGFPFARPTTFQEPMFSVGALNYYAVDHTPTYLWRSASWEISGALIPYLPKFLAGSDAWQTNETLRRAIEIERGVIQNPKILSFQKRRPEYPHEPLPG